MNWKLLFALSLLGLLMGIATVYWINQRLEPVFWLVVLVFSARMITRSAPGRYFLHGIYLGLLNCVWVTAAHVLLFHTYWVNHPQMAEMSQKMFLADHPRRQMVAFGPVIGAISGILIGLIAVLMAGLGSKKAATA